MLSEWLQNLDYEIPDNSDDKEFYAIKTPEYLHRKVIYEYFNLVIKYLPLNKLFKYIRNCRLASPADKMMILLRWVKKKIVTHGSTI